MDSSEIEQGVPTRNYASQHVSKEAENLRDN